MVVGVEAREGRSPCVDPSAFKSELKRPLDNPIYVTLEQYSPFDRSLVSLDIDIHALEYVQFPQEKGF